MTDIHNIRDMKVVKMNPKEIRFSQDSISETFNGPDGWSIWKLFDDIYDGRLDIARPTLMISVVFQDGHYFVEEGNRRLYIYKLLEDLDKINKIQVAEQFKIQNKFWSAFFLFLVFSTLVQSFT